MPPRQRGGKRQGGAATTPSAPAVDYPDDAPDELGLQTEERDSKNFEEFVRSTLAKIVNGQKQLEMKLAESIEFNSESIVKLQKEKADIEKDLCALKLEVSSLTTQVAKQSSEINKQERFSRRNNFRVVGIDRQQGENCTTLIENILASKFGWSELPRIERAHRDGQGKNGKPPHILVKMCSFQDKLRVFRERHRALDGSSLYILDDLTAQDRQERARWKNEVKTLYEQGTKLRFSAGRWRTSKGVTYEFN